MNLSQANILVEQALSAYQSKRFDDAEELWAVAGKLCAEGRQWIGVATCHLNRGDALANLGRFAGAIAEFDRAEPIFDHFKSDIGAAGCRISRGDALANYEQARSIIFEICQWSDVTRYQMDMGIALQHPRQYEQAIAECRSA